MAIILMTEELDEIKRELAEAYKEVFADEIAASEENKELDFDDG